jgi:hypothetical protein
MKRTAWIIMHAGIPVAATLDPFEAEELLNAEREAAEYEGSRQIPYMTSVKLKINEQ